MTAGTSLGVALHANEVASDLIAGGGAAKLAGAAWLGGADFVECANHALAHERDFVMHWSEQGQNRQEGLYHVGIPLTSAALILNS